ncbi:hypothetical protein [Acidisoma sp. L85]|uniref:hypothetical protein n=1 Tax=Acidisoma sp. L85 TaxID=1641850 RepID=UPI00131ACA33|nr:hypothetical protein [Acidisoma sp. L85]
MRPALLIAGLVLLSLAACSTPPNVRSASDYDAPAAPRVKHPLYGPYAGYGQANATWRPPVVNRAGTVVKPSDPSVDEERPDYEHAQWATGAAGGSTLAPPGTF